MTLPTTREFVRIALRCPDGKYLAVARRYDRKLMWNFPGGKVESGETPQEAVIRELMEETGVRISDCHLFYKDSFQLGNSCWTGYFFFASVAVIDAWRNSPDEIAEIACFHWSELDRKRSYSPLFTRIVEMVEAAHGSLPQNCPNEFQLGLKYWSNSTLSLLR